MLKKVMVVSDNAVLLAYFQDLCRELGVATIANIEYRYSLNNSMATDLINLGAHPMDFKEPEVLAYARRFDLIISMHCKQIFPCELVSDIKCVNIHPGFNPHGRGWYPQVFSIIENTPAGATIHIMDCDIDNGPIIDREEVPLFSNDTSLDVYERILELEKKLLRKNIYPLIKDTYTTYMPEQEGQCKLIKDFRDLCALDLKSSGPLGKHIDLLRALTHDGYNNAYFVDSDGNKIFVKISLTKELKNM